MKRVIKNNYKIIIAFVLGIIVSATSVYAVEAYIESKKVSYDNKYTNKNNTQEAIDELYERSGIHKEEWEDPTLEESGNYPVIGNGLIPVEIKPNGETYYANTKSEWYNYGEKRWANAVILNDDVVSKYSVGMQIQDSDIKGYFVWIPRYSYKIWNTGEYTKALTLKDLTDAQDTATSLWRITGNSTRIIDIKFVNTKTKDEGSTIDSYLTHPAFTLGDKTLSGIWVGKFETGGSIDSLIVKPSVVSLRNKTLKEFFYTAKKFTATKLDSHMMKNTEWGAVAYLSHSQYGIGNEVNINNTSDYYTGYSAAPNTDQSSRVGTIAIHTNTSITQPWNTPVGYLASTTGNISGIYDMSGGAWEYVAAYRKGSTTTDASSFSAEEITQQISAGYIDGYAEESSTTTYNKRILGDATGEMGTFYNYNEVSNASINHSSWYGDNANFVNANNPWFSRSGRCNDGVVAGQFYFYSYTGKADGTLGFRLVLAPTK